MSQQIILPGEVGSTIEPRLTVEGIRMLIEDCQKSGRIPRAVLVSEYDRRDLNQDLLAGSAEPVAKDDQRPEHDGKAIGIVLGVVIACHPDIPRGRARLVFGPLLDQNRPGTGKIIVGA